ncbi:hypothetical protein PpBr36_04218 [Pyricularia pennisetigena]|uniref:hypothetical protein n=1 Tax=Pyricularia pennisetigena TaxID=1578925 RepID=UPI001154EFAA|nr:hypothetical protein PpBr36_04218 [Pyricularia pennisetigena]TLS27362.1 hypothetical protein PpBr36_04218 [Pyricularia pennisetigena]
MAFILGGPQASEREQQAIMDLDPSEFVSFYELDPTSETRCIYITRKGTRCKWHCQLAPGENTRARELYTRFTTMLDVPDLDQLQEYARLNCCGPKPTGARHQNQIEDRGNLEPLAMKWQDEIQQRDAEEMVRHHTRRSSRDLSQEQPSPSINTPSLNSPASSATSSISTTTPATTRYNLRSRPDSGAPGHSTTPSTNPPAPLSEFRGHVEEPKETVTSMFRRPLQDRDLESGRLYAFDRESSPGYVKIGWTAKSVQGRLESWCKCGYEPRLVHATATMPHAQRAETLVHYELVREWRAERWCRPCDKTHREWFEVGRERAKQVINGWATLLTVANPYGENGTLRDVWVGVIDGVARDGVMATAEELLARYALVQPPRIEKAGQAAPRSTVTAIPSPPATPPPIFRFSMGQPSPSQHLESHTTSSSSASQPQPRPEPKPFQFSLQDTQWISASTPVVDGKAAAQRGSERPRVPVRAALTTTRPPRPAGFSPSLKILTQCAAFGCAKGGVGAPAPAADWNNGPVSEVVKEWFKSAEPHMVPLPPSPPLTPITVPVGLFI